MENETENYSHNAKADILKRLEKRKEDLEQQRSANANERSKNALENQAILDKLNDWSTELLKKIETSNPQKIDSISNNKQPQSSTENYDKIISSLSEEIQKFDSYFNEKSCNLSPYDVRQTQIVTVQIKEKFLALQDSLRPKKKFGFKSKNKKITNRQPSSSESVSKGFNHHSEDQTKVEESSTSSDTGSYIIDNPDDANIIDVPSHDIEGRDVLVNGLKRPNNSDKITIRIFGSPGTLHATNMDNVILLCGPVYTSIFIENCKNCYFVVACQQLRIHTTTESHFYLHVTSKGIIEDCTRVGFAPYNLSYSTLDEDFCKSGINKEVNNWDKIDDFNWLSKEKCSPNWYILEEDHRKKDWPL